MVDFTESDLIDILFYLSFAQGDLEGKMGFDSVLDENLMDEWNSINDIKDKIRLILKV